MKYIIDKFTLLSCLVVDCWAATFSVAKACMLLLHRRRFVWCDLALERVASMLPHLTLVFTIHVLNKASKITGNDNVQLASYTFVKAMNVLVLKRRIDV